MPKPPPDDPAQTRMELVLPGTARDDRLQWTTADQVRLQGIEAARLMGYYPDYADIDWLVSVVMRMVDR